MFGVTNVLALLHNEVEEGKLSTGCRSFDKMLNGGFDYGKITEVYGHSGAGKTQLILQLAVNAAVQGHFAVIVDTERKLSTNRINKMITSNSLNHSIMDRILIRICRTKADLMATLNLLSALVCRKENIKVIMIDSFAHHMRCYTEDTKVRFNLPGMLYSMLEILNRLANNHNIAIILTNQGATARLEDGSSKLIPALGEAWRHAPPTRIWLKNPNLQNEGCIRRAVIVKSSRCGQISANFKILESGIADV